MIIKGDLKQPWMRRQLIQPWMDWLGIKSTAHIRFCFFHKKKKKTILLTTYPGVYSDVLRVPMIPGMISILSRNLSHCFMGRGPTEDEPLFLGDFPMLKGKNWMETYITVWLLYWRVNSPFFENWVWTDSSLKQAFRDARTLSACYIVVSFYTLISFGGAS